METQIRKYKKSYKGAQYFLDPHFPLPYAYPVQTKEENDTKSCKCVFIGHKDLQPSTLEKLY